MMAKQDACSQIETSTRSECSTANTEMPSGRIGTTVNWVRARYAESLHRILPKDMYSIGEMVFLE